MNKKIALAGVPNCGKTTFWNISTGKKGKIGNWPGVTSEKLSANLIDFPDTELVDLPGIYSLSGKNLEETAARNYLKSGKADSLIILIDGTKPESGIYLAMELLSLGIPAVLGINFCDELERKNISVDTKKLSNNLCAPVFLISAFKKINTKPLIASATEISFAKQIPLLTEEKRHAAASELVSSCFTAKGDSKSKSSFPSVMIIFCVLTAILFKCVFVLKDFFEIFFEHLTAIVSAFLNYISAPAILNSLFSDGIIPGFASLLSFLPELCAIFLIFAFLESSGYMARLAFLSDKPLKKIGLSGSSVIPLVLGFGCTVSAVYALKSSENKSSQSKTLSSLMFIPCSARLPLTFLICEAIFPVLKNFSVLIIYFSVLLLGAFLSFCSANTPSEFVLEIPEIRIPSVGSVIKTGWLRTCFFIKRASFVVVLTSVLIWFLENFSFSLKPTELFGDSILFQIGEFIMPVFIPAGIPFEGVVALFFGLFSKESSLSALIPLVSSPKQIFSPISAISFLLFYTLYSPCSTALSVIKLEFGIKKAIWLFLRQNALAYFVSFAFYQFSTLVINLFSL